MKARILMAAFCSFSLTALAQVSGGGGKTTINGQAGTVVVSASNGSTLYVNGVIVTGGTFGGGTGTVTNVSVTIGGFTITNPTTTPVLSGTLIVPNGGTGIATLTGIPYGTGTAALGTVTIGSNLLFTGGVLSGSGGTVTSSTSTLLSGTFPSPVTMSVSGSVSTLSGTTGVSFSVSKSGTTNQVIATSTSTKLVWNSKSAAQKDWDDYGNFSLANNRWTAPRAGRVTFTCSVYYLSSVANAEFQALLYRNGSLDRIFPATSPGGALQQTGCGGSVLITVAAGDYFELYTQHAAGTNESVYADDGTYTFWQGIYAQ